ncbi:hypothetical protein AMK14_30130 [Streptomyces sp. TSRI0445]|uniref:Metal-dependent phosphohydrolase n=1 Tax=Streptomyces globisporus TaxID=1908 RepID=A0ABN8VDI3_STRGL|nr:MULTISPECIES: hypothetical protein [Streptomyces]OKI63729.1 hypothetical protein AMK14_30130 [Streptomyces sp. TSRI0445]RDL01340.1 hypothetical protein DER30_7144 [Streptomyces sp. HB202]UIZ13465.1 hypothetical protein LZ559_14050 [Streptomyces sp. R527F]CAH9419101.1 hypothetical protein SGL43_06155 [Streptomyces globisporus]
MFKSGVGFLALFGLGWWLLATSALDGAARPIAVGGGCMVTVGLMLAARRCLPASAGAPFPADRRRRFNQINGLQWLVIIVIAVVCSRAGVPVLIPPLVALVVGLHFLPLAAVFGQPRLRVPAALLVGAGLAGAAVWLADGPDGAVRFTVGLVSALCLWGTALWTVAGTASAAGRGVTG